MGVSQGRADQKPASDDALCETSLSSGPSVAVSRLQRGVACRLQRALVQGTHGGLKITSILDYASVSEHDNAVCVTGDGRIVCYQDHG